MPIARTNLALAKCSSGSGNPRSDLRKAETAVVSDADVEAYYKAFPGFKAFADVTDEKWDNVLKKSRRMCKQGLSSRG